jgi:spermidine synthase
MKRATHDERRTTVTLSISIALVGFTAMAAQIIYLREFLIVFSGNELSIGILLANWLIGGAAGSLLIGRFADRLKHRITPFAACNTLVAVFLPASIVLIRSVKNILGAPAGAILPLGPLTASSFLIMAPIAMILGLMFALACRLRALSPAEGTAGISRAYMLETAGASLGGLITSFFFIEFLDPVYIMAILGAMNIITALILLVRYVEAAKKFTLGIAVAVFAVYIAAGALKWWDRIERDSLANEWSSFNILASGNSIYGNVVLTERTGLYSFFENGLHLYTVPDLQRQEEAVHFALLEHPRPKDVLLIGGGVGGLIDEILKYQVSRVDYVELDDLIVKMAVERLPADLSRGLKNAKVSVKNEDGRFFVKKTQDKYDCVLLDMGDPYTAQINRFYTVEFFTEVKRILKEGGIFSFGVSSSENYVNKGLADFLKSLYRTLSRAFNDVKIIPGNTAIFIASDAKGLLTYDYRVLMERAGSAGLELKYVREYYLSSRLSAERVSYIQDIVSSPPPARSNYDFRPVGYYYGMIFWASRFRDSAFGSALKSLSKWPLEMVGLALCLTIIWLGFLARRRQTGAGAVLLGGLALSGYDGMAFQVITLLSFQIIYGYLFYKLGIVLTFFMIGLALGSRFAMKLIGTDANVKKTLIGTQLAWGVYFLVSPAVFIVLANSRGANALWLGSNIFFPLISLLAGTVSGAQFALTGKAYSKKDDAAGKTGALTYGTDLAGACLGAIITGAFLIPVAGIVKAPLVVGFINFAMAVALTLALYSRNYKSQIPNHK